MTMVREELEVGLIRIYVVWYEYVQYLMEKENLDKKVYREWNLKVGQKFDPWWKDNWKLFAEPARGLVKKVSSIPDSVDKNTIYLKVPLDANPSTLLSGCKTIIESELAKRESIETPKHISKFGLEVNENFDYLVWSRRLKCLRLKEKNFKRIDIYDDLRKRKMKVRKAKQERTGLKEQSYYSGQSEKMNYYNKVSMVCRDITLAEKFLKNIEKGKFCTKFK
jgi:hypothetical protein